MGKKWAFWKTIGRSFETVGLSVACAATLGQSKTVNKTLKKSAKSIGTAAKHTVIYHAAKTTGTAVVTAGCAIATGATLGQCKVTKKATKKMAQKTG